MATIILITQVIVKVIVKVIMMFRRWAQNRPRDLQRTLAGLLGRAPGSKHAPPKIPKPFPPDWSGVDLAGGGHFVHSVVAEALNSLLEANPLGGSEFCFAATNSRRRDSGLTRKEQISTRILRQVYFVTPYFVPCNYAGELGPGQVGPRQRFQ